MPANVNKNIATPRASPRLRSTKTIKPQAPELLQKPSQLQKNTRVQLPIPFSAPRNGFPRARCLRIPRPARTTPRSRHPINTRREYVNPQNNNQTSPQKTTKTNKYKSAPSSAANASSPPASSPQTPSKNSSADPANPSPPLTMKSPLSSAQQAPTPPQTTIASPSEQPHSHLKIPRPRRPARIFSVCG